MFIVFFLGSFVATLQGQAAAPSVSVVSQLRCGSARFAVLNVSNRSRSDSIFFPLSPLYARGFTIHNVRLEVEDEGKWRLVGRGADIPKAGERELRPGESFVDFFLLPTPEQATVLAGSQMRLLIPYRTGGSVGRTETRTFEAGDLPLKGDLACPAAQDANLNAK